VSIFVKTQWGPIPSESFVSSPLASCLYPFPPTFSRNIQLGSVEEQTPSANAFIYFQLGNHCFLHQLEIFQLAFCVLLVDLWQKYIIKSVKKIWILARLY